MEEMVRKKVEEILEGTGGKLERNNVIRFDPKVPTKVVNDVAIRIDSIGISIERIGVIGDNAIIVLETARGLNPVGIARAQQIIDAIKV